MALYILLKNTWHKYESTTKHLVDVFFQIKHYSLEIINRRVAPGIFHQGCSNSFLLQLLRVSKCQMLAYTLRTFTHWSNNLADTFSKITPFFFTTAEIAKVCSFPVITSENNDPFRINKWQIIYYFRACWKWNCEIQENFHVQRNDSTRNWFPRN